MLMRLLKADLARRRCGRRPDRPHRLGCVVFLGLGEFFFP